MQKEIEIKIKYGKKECVLALRDEDGNRGLYLEDTAGDPFAFIRSDSESFEKFLGDGYNRADLAAKLIKFWEE